MGIGWSSLELAPASVPAQAAVPGDSGGVGERGHLVDDDPQALRVGSGRVIGGAQRRVQRLRGARPDGGRQLGDQLPLPRLPCAAPSRLIT